MCARSRGVLRMSVVRFGPPNERDAQRVRAKMANSPIGGAGYDSTLLADLLFEMHTKNTFDSRVFVRTAELFYKCALYRVEPTTLVLEACHLIASYIEPSGAPHTFLRTDKLVKQVVHVFVALDGHVASPTTHDHLDGITTPKDLWAMEYLTVATLAPEMYVNSEPHAVAEACASGDNSDIAKHIRYTAHNLGDRANNLTDRTIRLVAFVEYAVTHSPHRAHVFRNYAHASPTARLIQKGTKESVESKTKLGDGSNGDVYEFGYADRKALKVFKDPKTNWSWMQEIAFTQRVTSRGDTPNVMLIEQCLILEDPLCVQAIYPRASHTLENFTGKYDVSDMFRQICMGVKSIHDMGVLHLDLKPDNILIEDGVAKIADLGMCSPYSLTKDSPIFAQKLHWRAPEILSRSRKCSTPADCWSLGIILLELAKIEKPRAEDKNWHWKPTGRWRGPYTTYIYSHNTKYEESYQMIAIINTLGCPTKDERRELSGEDDGDCLRELQLVKGSVFYKEDYAFNGALGASWKHHIDNLIEKTSTLDTFKFTDLRVKEVLKGLLTYSPSRRMTVQDAIDTLEPVAHKHRATHI